MSTQTAQPEQRFLRELGQNAPHARRNHLLGVTAGMFAGVARDFVHPELIIVGLIWALTKNPYLVALVPIINKAGALTPQLLASTFIEHRPRRRPYFVLLTFIRTGSFVGLVAAMFLLTISVNWVHLMIFYTVYLLCCMTGGTGHVIFMDMVGRLIPSHRIGAFLGMRQFLGGGLSIITGLLIVQPILNKVYLPMNYVILAAIGAVLVGVDMGIFSQCREEPGPKADSKTTLMESMRRGLAWLTADHNYRCYFWCRIAFRLSYLGLAFFVPYGEDRLSREGAAGMAVLGGILVATFKGSGVIGSLIWGKYVDRFGSKSTMIWGGALMTVAPLMALLSPRLPITFELPLPYVERGLTLPLLMYLLALAVFQQGLRAQMLGGHRLLINGAPSHRRASYIAFLNTITCPLTLLPLAGAWLADIAGMDAVFVVVVIGGALMFVASSFMHQKVNGVTA
ncbi:MAG: hypothetical protein ACLFVU_10090 [Phycisphaerae bacterium]